MIQKRMPSARSGLPPSSALREKRSTAQRHSCLCTRTVFFAQLLGALPAAELDERLNRLDGHEGTEAFARIALALRRSTRIVPLALRGGGSVRILLDIRLCRSARRELVDSRSLTARFPPHDRAPPGTGTCSRCRTETLGGFALLSRSSSSLFAEGRCKPPQAESAARVLGR